MKVFFEDCVRVEDDLYFVCKDCNIICKLSIESGEIKTVSRIPEESACEWRLGAKIVSWNGFLYLAPMRAKKIWKYNIENKTWTGYDRKKLEKLNDYGDIFQAIRYKEKLFFIGCSYPAIIVLNLHNDELSYVTAPFDFRMEMAKKKADCFFRTDYVQIDEYLYMASCIDNTVLKFNMDTYDYEYVEVGEEGNAYAGIDFDGENFFLSPRRNGNGVVWNFRTSEVRNIELPSLSKNAAVFGGVICLANKVLFPACFSNDTVEIFYDGEQIKKVINIGKQYLFYKKIDECTVVSLDGDGQIVIDTPSRTFKYKCEMSDYEMGKGLRESLCGKSEYQFEVKENTLEFFLGTIVAREE